MTEDERRYRLRLTFAKETRVKYIGHLDLVRAWERAFRRARIPLAYSKGFNPQAKVQVAAALPVGHVGRAELMDIYLTEPMSADQLVAEVSQTLPDGLRLDQAQAVAPNGPSLQSQLRQGEYRVTVETAVPLEELRRRITDLLAAGEIRQRRVRRGREEIYDLRPLLHDLRVESGLGAEVVLWMRLSTGPSGNVRPEAVLDILGLAESWAQVERLRLIFADETENVA